MTEREIFIAALNQRDPAERAAFLERACGGDQAQRDRIEGLLREQAELGSFLERPAQDLRGTGPFAPAVANEVSTLAGEGPGAVIGPYQLVRPIGEGGMGTVYLAEQTEPVKRQVALKVIRPGMDSRQVIARFEAERQALALMDHPNIAKVFDGGTTASDRPYFVMELVQGVSITRYCDAHHLTPQQRLELFIPVCQAVQHAHQKGIIHRDIKPSNVLVASYDGKPVPKVIDFGIAKATGPQLTERTLETGLGTVVGTLEYMSPEQAGLDQLDIDTRSDIYSLGVLLYELLTGSTPLDKKRFKAAAVLELLRLVREEEPPRPSTRLSSTDGLASVAANRGLEPKKLSGQVRGELDWMVMKALEKDRNRRYETANGLAMDVQRYLHDEPVQACPPSAWYRLRKFSRRNKGAFTAAALVLLALVVGTAVSTWQAIRATQARDAERAAHDALDTAREEKQQQRSHLNQALSDALVEAAGLRAQAKAAGPADTKYWNRLREAVRRAEGLAESELADPHLAGQVKALRAELDRDEADRRMVAQLEESRLEWAVVKDEGFDTAGAAAAFVAAFRNYGLPVLELDAGEAARRIRASAIRAALVAGLDDWARVASPPTREQLLTLAQGLDGDPWRRQCRQALLQDDPAALVQLAQRPEALQQGAPTLAMLGTQLGLHDLAAAVELLRRAQQRYPADFWINHQLARHLQRLGQAHVKEAIGFYRVALALRPQSPGVYVNLGVALQEGKAVEEALAAYQQAIHLKSDYAVPHNNLGLALQAKGDLPGAIAAHQKAIALNPESAKAHFSLGVALQAKGDSPGAIAAFQKAIALKPEDAMAYTDLGNALQTKGDLAGAIAAFHKAIALKPDLAEAHYNLGCALNLKWDLPGSIAAFQKAIALKPDFAEAHCNLGKFLRRQGQFRAALAETRRGHELGSKDPHWRYPSAQWVRQDERLVELDEQLPGFLEGKTTPASADERIEIAELCTLKRLHRAAARFYEEAFAAQPKLLTAQRYNAASAAALAGCGCGDNATHLDDRDRERLRSQALGWLRDELTQSIKELGNNRPVLQRRLRNWQGDPNLAGVREPEQLAKLPPAEQEAWRRLWAEVTELLATGPEAPQAETKQK